MRWFRVIVFIFLVFMNLEAFGVSSYGIYSVGVKGRGLADAFVGYSDNLEAIYYNPAGLLTIPNDLYILYTASGYVNIPDYFDFSVKFLLDYSPFISLGIKERNFILFLSYLTLYRENNFNVKYIPLSSAFSILPNWGVGVSFGPAIGYLYNSFSIFPHLIIGTMIKPIQQLQVGLCIRSPLYFYWKELPIASVERQLFPAQIDVGFIYLLHRLIRMTMDITTYFWDMYEEEVDGYLHRLNRLSIEDYFDVKLGIEFLHVWTGAHIRLGIKTSKYVLLYNVYNQFALSVGIGVTSRLFKIEFGAEDTSLLRNLGLYRYNKPEIVLSLSFLLQLTKIFTGK